MWYALNQSPKPSMGKHHITLGGKLAVIQPTSTVKGVDNWFPQSVVTFDRIYLGQGIFLDS